jgi:hypothetical protein
LERYFQIWKTRDAWRWFRTPIQPWTLLLNLWKFFKSHFMLPNLTKATDNCAALFSIWWIVLPLAFLRHFFRKARLLQRVLRIPLMTVAKQFINFILWKNLIQIMMIILKVFYDKGWYWWWRKKEDEKALSLSNCSVVLLKKRLPLSYKN